jgi:YndJ-like protein
MRAAMTDHLGLLEVLFLFAPWLVVPLGIRLSRSNPRGPVHTFLKSALNKAWLLAACAATASFWFPRGARAAACAIVWLSFCALTLIDGAKDSFRSRAWTVPVLCFRVAEAYLVVGGVWLVISRWGGEPLGFQEPIVFLTAVHFHFAGFASAVLAGLTYERLRGAGWTAFLRCFLPGVVLGPGLLGLAFLAGRA